MKNRIFRGALTTATLFAFAAAAANAQTPSQPLRHLVYAFTVGHSSDLTVHDSGIGGSASGMNDYRGGSGDKGTIVVDVMQVGSDGGLVVNVSETARESRDAKPSLCAVYGNGNAICDPNAKVNDEEFALLRVIGRGFFDPSQLDARKHWQTNGSINGGTDITDYTVTGEQGDMYDIMLQEVQKLEGAQGFAATTDGQISYNLAKTIPIKVHEHTTMRRHEGMGQDNKVESDYDLTLVSDSLGAVTGH